MLEVQAVVRNIVLCRLAMTLVLIRLSITTIFKFPQQSLPSRNSCHVQRYTFARAPCSMFALIAFFTDGRDSFLPMRTFCCFCC